MASTRGASQGQLGNASAQGPPPPSSSAPQDPSGPPPSVPTPPPTTPMANNTQAATPAENKDSQPTKSTPNAESAALASKPTNASRSNSRMPAATTGGSRVLPSKVTSQPALGNSAPSGASKSSATIPTAPTGTTPQVTSSPAAPPATDQRDPKQSPDKPIPQTSLPSEAQSPPKKMTSKDRLKQLSSQVLGIPNPNPTRPSANVASSTRALKGASAINQTKPSPGTRAPTNGTVAAPPIAPPAADDTESLLSVPADDSLAHPPLLRQDDAIQRLLAKQERGIPIDSDQRDMWDHFVRATSFAQEVDAYETAMLHGSAQPSSQTSASEPLVRQGSLSDAQFRHPILYAAKPQVDADPSIEMSSFDKDTFDKTLRKLLLEQCKEKLVPRARLRPLPTDELNTVRSALKMAVKAGYRAERESRLASREAQETSRRAVEASDAIVQRLNSRLEVMFLQSRLS